MAEKSIKKNNAVFTAEKMDDVSNNIKKSEDSSDAPKKVRFAKWKKFNDKRRENTEKYGMLNTFLMIIFPVFILTLAASIEGKGLSKFFGLWVHSPGAMIFALIITYIVFALMLAVFKHGWLAMLAHSILYIALSTTELFKFNTNGNHLILSDMKLFRSVKSLQSFAYIKITPLLVISYIIAIAFLVVVFYFNPKSKMKAVPRIVTTVFCLLLVPGFVMLPDFYNPVYSFFHIDTTAANNDILLKEKFNNNGFFTFLVQTASESYANRIVEPDEYDDIHVDDILDINVVGGGNFNNGQKPNVIVIMSESFADFRVFDQLDIDDEVYKYFDKACEEGKSGTVITPTYASWTVRSEFELMFGLPVKGINDPNMPQRELAERELPAMAQYYDTWGYETAYIHPFQSTFYGRKSKYPRLGFKQLIFHDSLKPETDTAENSDFTVPIERYGTYVDDKTIFNQIIKLLNETDKPMYIHTTTMQNHQPYNLGEDPDDEFGNYLQWIQHSNEGLNAFLESLKTIDEPTLVFFVGDHFPSLRGETSVYNELGINSENCSILYEQKYFLWSNYDADFSDVPDEKISFFYTPYVILDIIDAPHDSFIEKMMQFMKEIPVYSTAYNSEIPNNEELDVLTYDRVVGDLYSESPITENNEGE